MKKVIVIGSPGAGKSTFARRLRDCTGLPLYYLDMIWHRPDRTTLSREEFERKIREKTAEDSWILDGNYLGRWRCGWLRAIRCFISIIRWKSA